MKTELNENQIVKAIENGIPLDTNTPFMKIAESLSTSEEIIISSIQQMIDEKKIKRFGPVVKNRSLGINQNAMVTLKVNPERVEECGKIIASKEFVTLCYERAIVPDVWEFNLYFMIHGRQREIVLDQIEQVKKELDIADDDIRVLFSSKCFKQKGASY